MRTFAIGDIHGAYRALVQCLEQSKFDYKKDELIVLGDIVDGWSETPECIEELKKIKNLVVIMGNHDYWAFNWFQMGQAPIIWTEQGGQATIDAYVKRREDLLVEHRDFFKQANYLMIDEDNRIYLHGGFTRGIKLESQTPQNFMWDRTLATKAANCNKKGREALNVKEFHEVFLGHTTVNSFKQLPKNKPHIGGNVILLDTGAGWEGVLTIMDVETKKYWQSDLVSDLYPDERGRN